MKKIFRKTISLLLALVMLFSLAVPGLAGSDFIWASQSHSDIPLIRISGDGEALADADGNKVFHYKDFASLLKSDDSEEDGSSPLMEALVNIIKPLAIDGLLTDNWDPLYEALQVELTKIFEKTLLDKDGNAQYGTGLRPWRKDMINAMRTTDYAAYAADGTKYYIADSYYWRYDWRLDPIETAGEFKAFIDDVMAATGSEQVGIMATCLGTNVITAYLACYPDHAKQYVRGVAYDGSVVGGAEMLSETISGKFRVRPDAVNRILIDCNETGLFSIDAFVMSTIDMLVKTGILDTIVGTTEEMLYDKLVVGMTSALALSTFYTFPNYWACVSPEDYDTAKEYVFGPEGSEKRTEYAGLIAKLDRYNEVVRQRVPEILTQTKENGINIGIISKYGFQNLPVCESSDMVSDQFASVKRSSFGATTGTIYNDLSDEYIASRVEKGFGKYISPDNQIDASTCLFPDSTWFIKGSSHSNWSDWETRLMYDIASSEQQLTIDNSCWPSQFVVYEYTDPDNAVGGEIYKMTKENCDTENWEAEEKYDDPETIIDKLMVAVLAFVNWLVDLFQKLLNK